MINISKSDKVLFCFSNPGGAKMILSKAHYLKDKIENFTIISDVNYDFYSDFNLDVKIISSKNELEETIKNFEPNILISGTSDVTISTFELDVISFIDRNNVKVFSFVDHWTSIKNRFLYKNEYVYPDKIYLIDEYAKKTAIQEGIPIEILDIENNMYYSFFKESILNSNISKEQILKGLNPNNKTILVALEPILNFEIQNYLSFNEVIFLNNLLVDEITDKFNVIIKVHPIQNIELIKDLINKFSSNNNILFLFESKNLNHLIYFSDIIVGVFSNMLIEANLLGKNIVRFFPDDNTYKDPIIHILKDNPCKSFEDFRNEILDFIQN